MMVVTRPGATFTPDEALVPGLLDNLPTLSLEDRDTLELPFTLGELEATVEASASAKGPGLDGLPYKFTKQHLLSIYSQYSSFCFLCILSMKLKASCSCSL